jgi:hypothetical protein
MSLDPNLTPFEQPPGSWGVAVHENHVGNIRRKPINSLDVLYAAFMSKSEDADRHMVMWCMIQNWAAGPYSTWKRLLEMFSAAINPTFAFLHSPTPEYVGRYPGPGGRGIPGEVNRRLWDQIMASSGRVKSHIIPMRLRQLRRDRFDEMRSIAGGDRTKWGRLPLSSRVAAFNVCSARCKNPIPGYDTFGNRNDWSSRIRNFEVGGLQSELRGLRGDARDPVIAESYAIAFDLTGTARQQAIALSQAANKRDRKPIRFGNSDRGYNYYGYRMAGLSRGGEVWVEHPASGRSSKTAPLIGLNPGTSGVNISNVRLDTNVVPVTASGLRPTEQIPAVTANTSENNRTIGSQETNNQVLESGQVLFDHINQWARETEEILSREVGRGVRR